MKDTTHPSLPQAGQVLIAHPDMPGNLFSQTLVYLHTHDPEGSLGLILNRPSGQTLGSVVRNPELPEALRALPLYYGGPVQPDQFLLSLFVCNPHTRQFHMELHPDPDRLITLQTDPHTKIRAFVGYAGWTAGQLDQELRGSDWRWTAADVIMLTEKPTPSLWELLVQGDSRWQKLRDYFPAAPERN